MSQSHQEVNNDNVNLVEYDYSQDNFFQQNQYQNNGSAQECEGEDQDFSEHPKEVLSNVHEKQTEELKEGNRLYNSDGFIRNELKQLLYMKELEKTTAYSLKLKIKSSTAEIANLKNYLKKIEIENENLSRTIENENKALEPVKINVFNACKMVRSLNDFIKTINDNQQNLREKNKLFDDKLNAFMQTISEYQKKKNKISKLQSTINNKKKYFKDKIDKIRQENIHLQAEAVKKQNNDNDLKVQNDKMILKLDNIDKLKAKIRETKHKLNEIRKRVSEKQELKKTKENTLKQKQAEKEKFEKIFLEANLMPSNLSAIYLETSKKIENKLKHIQSLKQLNIELDCKLKGQDSLIKTKKEIKMKFEEAKKNLKEENKKVEEQRDLLRKKLVDRNILFKQNQILIEQDTKNTEILNNTIEILNKNITLAKKSLLKIKSGIEKESAKNKEILEQSETNKRVLQSSIKDLKEKNLNIVNAKKEIKANIKLIKRLKMKNAEKKTNIKKLIIRRNLLLRNNEQKCIKRNLVEHNPPGILITTTNPKKSPVSPAKKVKFEDVNSQSSLSSYSTPDGQDVLEPLSRAYRR